MNKQIEQIKKHIIENFIDKNNNLTKQEKLLLKSGLVNINDYEELCNFIIDNSFCGPKTKQYVKLISKMKISNEEKISLLITYVNKNNMYL